LLILSTYESIFLNILGVQYAQLLNIKAGGYVWQTTVH